jgi:glutamate 5-kinase
MMVLLKRLKRHRSLLPVGVKAVEGHFDRGDVVECVDKWVNVLLLVV